MKKVLKKRAGFTLVELLIVIIIIGILAGAMLLVAGSGTDKAEATKIVSDLRSLKAAALMYYADHPSESATPEITSLDSYMDKKMNDGATNYAVADTSGVAPWYVGRITFPSAGVKTKLKDMAKQAGLIEGSATEPSTASGDYAGGEGVWMRSR